MKAIKIFLLCFLGIFTFNLGASTYRMYNKNINMKETRDILDIV